MTTKYEGVESNTNEYRKMWMREQRANGRYVENDLEYLKKYRMKARYGITLEEYDVMNEEQNGQCAICGTTGGKYEETKKCGLSVDHCHETGTIRGLLCNDCNTGIGHFKDNPQLLNNAYEYLT